MFKIKQNERDFILFVGLGHYVFSVETNPASSSVQIEQKHSKQNFYGLTWFRQLFALLKEGAKQ